MIFSQATRRGSSECEIGPKPLSVVVAALRCSLHNTGFGAPKATDFALHVSGPSSRQDAATYAAPFQVMGVT